MTVPEHPKIFHIIHVDRLPSVLNQERLWSDAQMRRLHLGGSNIGMSHIKERRLRTPLGSHQGLCVGDCVPFYFCPRSVMLYLLYRGNHPDLSYSEGQEPILHLQADMRQVVKWADEQGKRWAFTSSNAGSIYFDDWRDLSRLDQIDWGAVRANDWRDPAVKERKQAEFLLEDFLPWRLVEAVVTQNEENAELVLSLIAEQEHKPRVRAIPAWYY